MHSGLASAEALVTETEARGPQKVAIRCPRSQRKGQGWLPWSARGSAPVGGGGWQGGGLKGRASILKVWPGKEGQVCFFQESFHIWLVYGLQAEGKEEQGVGGQIWDRGDAALELSPHHPCLHPEPLCLTAQHRPSQMVACVACPVAPVSQSVQDGSFPAGSREAAGSLR